MKVELIRKARLDGKDIKPGDMVDIDNKLALAWIDKNIARMHVPGQARDVFSKMSRKELLKFAEEKGIEISKLKKAKKDDIIALLKECENSPNEEGGEDHDEGTKEEEQNKEAGNGDKEPD